MPGSYFSLSPRSILDPIAQRYIETGRAKSGIEKAERAKVKQATANQRQLELDAYHKRINPDLGKIPTSVDTLAGVKLLQKASHASTEAQERVGRSFQEAQTEVDELPAERKKAIESLEARDKAHSAAVQKTPATARTHYIAVKAREAGPFRYPVDVVKTSINDKIRGIAEGLNYPWNVVKTFITYKNSEEAVNKAFQEHERELLDRRMAFLRLPDAPAQRNNRPANNVPAEETPNHSISWRII